MLKVEDFFDSLRSWFKDLEQSETWSQVQYSNGRIVGMLDVAVDTGIISINTWRNLYHLLNKKVDLKIEGGVE